MRCPRRATSRLSAPLAVGLVWLIPTLAAGQPSGAAAPKVRVAVDEPLAGDPILTAAPSFPVAVRITVEFSALLGDRAASTFDRLDERLRDHAAAGVPVWVSVDAPVPTVEGVGSMVEAIRALADRAGTRVAWYEIAFPENTADIRLTAFALKQVALELRSVSPAVRCACRHSTARDTGLARAAVPGRDRLISRRHRDRCRRRRHIRGSARGGRPARRSGGSGCFDGRADRLRGHDRIDRARAARSDHRLDELSRRAASCACLSCGRATHRRSARRRNRRARSGVVAPHHRACRRPRRAPL